MPYLTDAVVKEAKYGLPLLCGAGRQKSNKQNVTVIR